jgi:hypothetical protein
MAKYAQRGLAFTIPTLTGIEVVLPPSQAHWLLDQPDHVLSARAALIERLVSDYTFFHPKIMRDSFHVKSIKKHMAVHLRNLVPDIADEISWTIDKNWGRNINEWTSIDLQKTIPKIFSGCMSRALIRLPFCIHSTSLGFAYADLLTGRNDEYLESSIRFTRNVFQGSTAVLLFPEILRG